jgi:hypothetical protein
MAESRIFTGFSRYCRSSESELSLLQCEFLVLSGICGAEIHETHYGYLTWILAIEGGRLRALFCR